MDGNLLAQATIVKAIIVTAFIARADRFARPRPGAPCGSADWAILPAGLSNLGLNRLALAPRLSIDEDRISASTHPLAQALWLFSYERKVDIDCPRRTVTIQTTRLWFWRKTRVVPFDRIDRIIYCGQGMPTLSGTQTAFFLIKLGLKDGGGDLELFTVLEQQPHPHDWLDKMAGATPNEARVGDEAAVKLVDLLRRYIGVPIARD
jgi:hypothetical protein